MPKFNISTLFYFKISATESILWGVVGHW